MRHHAAFPDRARSTATCCPSGGQYQWRKRRRARTCSTPSPSTACRRRCAPAASRPSRSTRSWSTTSPSNLCTLRGLLDFKAGRRRSRSRRSSRSRAIVKRFKTGAMSYGSISKEAHETLAIAMNRIGGKSNTGEGGEDPDRYKPLAERRLARIPRSSRWPRAASASPASTWSTRASCRSRWRRARSPARAASCPAPRSIRGSPRPATPPPGVGLISPPPHHDIYSIEDLAELIHDLKNGNRDARISVKLVAEVGVGTIAAGVAKAHADVVLISGYDGGTGASPQTSITHAGLPWELGLAETHQTLVLNNLRSRIAVETDGQLKTGRDVVIAALLGAEEFGFATAPLVATGLHHDARLPPEHLPGGRRDPGSRSCARKFTGKPEHVVNFMRFIAEDVRADHGAARLPHHRGDGRAASTGSRPRKAVDALEGEGPRFQQHPLPARRRPERSGRFCQITQDHGLDKSLDVTTLLDLCRARDRARREGRRRAADPQRPPRRRHDHRRRGHEEVGRGGPARGHDPHPLQGLGRPELRRLHAARA